MSFDGGASKRHGDFEVGVRDVIDWFRCRFGGGREVVSEALVVGFFGPERRSVEAVGAAAVAEPHGLGHLRRFRLGQDVQCGHAEGVIWAACSISERVRVP
jgi:hypothetical protein